MRLFDRLNSPVVVVSVLGVVVALNGLLLLNRYGAFNPDDSPTPTEIQDEQANSRTGVTTPETTVRREETTTPPPPEPEPRPETQYSRPETRYYGVAPPAYAPSTLEEAIVVCETTEVECLSAYVAGIAPLATYAEAVPGVDSSPSETNRLFYFSDPSLAPCQYSREDYTFGNGVTYTVIIYGEGSFDENASGCIPSF